MLVRWTPRPLALLALVLLPACSTARQSSPQSGPRSHPISIVVENRSFADMTIYAQLQSIRYRLGIVGGFQTARLALPPGMRGSLRLQADPLGSQRKVHSERIDVDYGDRVEWTIETTPGLSFALVRPQALP